MWHDMFVEQIPLAEKILRTVIVYALIVVLFRLTGKRGLASLNTFDFVVIFLLSNVVQNAIIGNDQSLLGGMIGAVTLVVVNVAVDRLIAVNATAARVFEGTATTVISDGRILDRALRRLGMRSSEIEHAVRIQNADDVRQIETGSLDPNGQLLLTLKATEQSATKADVAELTERLRAHRTAAQLKPLTVRRSPATAMPAAAVATARTTNDVAAWCTITPTPPVSTRAPSWPDIHTSPAAVPGSAVRRSTISSTIGKVARRRKPNTAKTTSARAKPGTNASTRHDAVVTPIAAPITRISAPRRDAHTGSTAEPATPQTMFTISSTPA